MTVDTKTHKIYLANPPRPRRFKVLEFGIDEAAAPK